MGAAAKAEEAVADNELGQAATGVGDDGKVPAEEVVHATCHVDGRGADEEGEAALTTLPA